MALSKDMKLKLEARKEEYEFNQDILNQKLAFATQTYHLCLPELGSNTTTHEKLLLPFKDLNEMLIAVKTNYKQYDVDPQYTRNRDGIFRVCLVKSEPLQHKELSRIEADIKNSYKESLNQIKNTIINEILEEVAAEKFAQEEQKRLDRLDKEEEELRKALLSVA